MKTRNVHISGADEAGSALAYWLHRHGFSPTGKRARALAACLTSTQPGSSWPA